MVKTIPDSLLAVLGFSFKTRPQAGLENLPRISSADSPKGGVITKPNGLQPFRLFLLKQDRKRVWKIYRELAPLILREGV